MIIKSTAIRNPNGLGVCQYESSFFGAKLQPADMVTELNKRNDCFLLPLQKPERESGNEFRGRLRNAGSRFKSLVMRSLCLIFRGGGNSTKHPICNTPTSTLAGKPISLVNGSIL